MNEPSRSPPPEKPPPEKPPSRRSRLRELAGRLSHKSMPRGELAALRRLDPARPSEPALWRLLFAVLPEEEVPASEALVRRWALAVKGMALMAPLTRQESGVSGAGAALVEIGYSEARLARLLAARGEAFEVLFLRLCRQLAAGGQRVNWGDLGLLALSGAEETEAAEGHRLALARAYYHSLHKSQAVKEPAA